MATTQPIRNKHQVRELTDYYLKRDELRNYLLIVMGVHTALRISDLLLIKWDDVYSEIWDAFRYGMGSSPQRLGCGLVLKFAPAYCQWKCKSRRYAQ